MTTKQTILFVTLSIGFLLGLYFINIKRGVKVSHITAPAAVPSTASSVRELASDPEFEELVIRAPGVTIVKYHATWCPACQDMKKPFAALADELKAYRFIGIDVDKFADLAKSQNVRGIPRVDVYRDGKKLKELLGVGSLSQEAMKTKIENCLNAETQSV